MIQSFSSTGRRAWFQELIEKPCDLLIIGGGITGAGIARDAATRGLSVGLIEQTDFASGTSSRSSKLIHGGLRYLDHYAFGLIRQSTVERRTLHRIAPHLCQPLALTTSDLREWLVSSELSPPPASPSPTSRGPLPLALPPEPIRQPLPS